MFALALTGCAAQQAYAPGSADVTAQPEVRPSEYVLRPADKVRITVFNEPTLSGEFVVDQAGTLALPLIGVVNARGVSVADLDKTIEARLSEGYLRDPNVSVEVLTYRPFYILGEVNRAGEYPFTDRITVLQAIATAQGFTYRADRKRVFIKRAGQDNEEVVPLTSTLMVGPGDTIRVGERYF